MKLTIHHLVPRSKGGSNEKINRIQLYEAPHVNHHRVFNNLTPVEQIRRIVEFNAKVLTDKTVRDVINVLSYQSEELYYHEGVRRQDKSIIH